MMTRALLLVLLLPTVCFCQGNSTEQAKTSGPCSPAVSGNNNQLKMNCRGMPIEKTAKVAVMVPFDTAPKSTPIPTDENPDDPLFRTYGTFQSLASYGTIPDDTRDAHGNGQVTWEAQPISVEEAPDFLARMLQYYVFQSIDALQRDTLTVSVGYPAQATAGIEPPDAESYSYKRLAGDLDKNVFFKPFRYRESGDEMLWKMKPVKMPKRTDIQFFKNPDGYVVRLKRLKYYVADFSVKSFVGTGTGSIPKYFVTSHAATTMQWTFFITMRYSIEQPDDTKFNPNTYAQWLDSLFDGLRKRLALD